MKRFKINKKTFLWAVLIGLMGTVILTSVQAAAFRAEKEELQQRLDREIQEGIAEEIFRLHVVANSDSQEDQELKMAVKKTVVDCLAQGLGEKAGLEETRNWVLENLSDIENAAAETIKSQGETYPVAARLLPLRLLPPLPPKFNAHSVHNRIAKGRCTLFFVQRPFWLRRKILNALRVRYGHNQRNDFFFFGIPGRPWTPRYPIL